MKIKELRELSTDELITRRRDLRKEIFNFRLQQQAGSLERPSVIRINRREVARIETVLTERTAERQTPASAAGTQGR
jgi:large subunit ribosomal protein L29